MDKATHGEKSSSSSSSSLWMEPYLKKFKLGRSMNNEREALRKRYRDELREEMKDPPFKPEKFGDPRSLEKISDSLLRHGVVSVALYSERVLVYACSGTAVRYKYRNMRDHHNRFVTSARLAHKFEDNRTRDDNLRIELRTSDNEILHGFLELYDDTMDIAIVTSFSLQVVYPMDTSNPVNLQPNTRELFAYGCSNRGTLMGANCSHPVFEDNGLVSLTSNITESGLGGPVLYFGPRGVRIAGLIVGSGEDKIVLLPTKKLNGWLKRILLITSKAPHFRGYSLPEGVKTAIPSGFMVQSKILQSLGYPLPPPLMFELNGRLSGRFEEHFGQLHYWEGYPFNLPYNYGPKPIWEQLGKELAQEISQSVVSIASFKDNTRCFACTGMFITGITGRDYQLVLTSASLVRTGDAEGKIDETLRIEVFLPPNHSVEGILELYHENYNIALVRLKYDLTTAISPQDIFNVRESTENKSVVAIGRGPKRSHGLLMASMGEAKGKYETERKSKRSTGVDKKVYCPDLLMSTCQIKKVGIGCPLIDLDGNFIGMNFYDESETTPFLPMKTIVTVLHEGFDLLQSSTLVRRPINMEDIESHLSSKTRKRKRSCWPVSEAYWFLAGEVHPLDQLVGKVLM